MLPDPAPQRLQDRQPDGAGPHPRRRARVAAARLRPHAALRRRRRAVRRAPGAGRHPRHASWTTSPPSRPIAGSTRPALADDRAADAQGLDGAEGGRRQAGRGHLPLPPGPARGHARPTPGTGPSSRSGCAATGPRSSSTTSGRLVPELRALAPEGDRRMSANPHANGGRLLRDLEMPDFRDYAVDGRAAGPRRRARRPASSASSSGTCGAATDDRFRLFGPDEIASNRLQAVFEVTDRAWNAERDRRRRPPRPRRPGDGDPLRAPLPGLARGLPAHRPARPVHLLRGVRPHRRLDAQPARQVAEDDARHPVARARSRR